MSYLCFILIVIIPGCFSSMNIAKGKTATQSSNQKSAWGADKAVDGFINRNGIDREVTCGCCSHTAVGRTDAFWQVDLETTSRIQNVTIYYRKLYTYRFAGFSLYVSNTSRTKEKLCFKHTGNALPDPIKEIDCPSTARYVYFYNERLSGTTYPASYSTNAVIELCEVEVYGCPLMKYGDTCSEDCSVGCNDISYVCEPDTGNCTSDCRTGFTGSRCDECIVGFYDIYCNKSCSDGCLDVSCYRFNGKCEKGCKDNFSGDRCRDCIDGKHGEKCDLDCSENCLNKTCHQTTGICRFGCNANWNGSQCQECIVGLYGDNCDEECSVGCKPGGCSKNSGYCNNGCIQGFVGDNCDSCVDGFYGELCEQNCSENCLNLQCNQQTGFCIAGCTFGWGGDICNFSISLSASDLQETQTPVIVSLTTILGIFVVIAVAVIIVVTRRRSKRNGHTSKENILEPLDITSEHAQNAYNNGSNRPTRKHQNSNKETRYSRSEIYNNTAEVYYNLSIPGIPVEEIKDYLSQKTKEDFEKEYSMLSEGSQFPHEHSKKANNKLKNRFQKSYCYDHSRVILDSIPGEDDSDYINANYIDRVDRPKYYIATQGPKDDTIRDFWRMVWQVKSSVIIMLTNLIEKGKVKCSRYWPELKETIKWNDIAVSSEVICDFATYTVREFCVTNTTAGESRKVIQYHFTAWPDHGTPDPIEIIVFAHKIMSCKKESSGPNIIHCSAGIGRTGTYLALDALLEYGKRTGRINIFEFVRNMRKDRMNMIQTVDQYVFLNEVFAEAFQFEDTSLTGESLMEFFADFLDEDDNFIKHHSDKPDRINTEFKMLQNIRHKNDPDEFKTALLKSNLHKNKPNCPLASEKYRPFINSRYASGTNYINAILLPSFDKKTGYAVSHFPLSDTTLDFWSLIIDHNSTTLVLLDIDFTKVDEWFPVNRSEKQYGPFTIRLKNGDTFSDDLSSFEYNVVEKATSNEVIGKAFILASWRDNSLPPSYQDILKLIELIDIWVKSRKSDLITVLCRDGVTACSVFCVVRDLINSLKLNGEIDFFQTDLNKNPIIQSNRPTSNLRSSIGIAMKL